MRNLTDESTKILPSTTRGGKELPSSSALDSPSVISRLATPKPATAMNSDMSHVIDDATCAMHDEKFGKIRGNEITEEPIIVDSDDEGSTNDYVLPVVPKGYVMNEEAAREIFACNDRYDLKKLLAKWNQQSLNARMKPDPAF